MPSPSTCLASLQGFIEMIVFPPIRDGFSLVISQTDWSANLRNCVHLISCLLLRKWNGTAIKHEKPLAVVRHHTGFILWCLQCATWSCVTTGLCWFTELFVFSVVVFTPQKLYFVEITDPTEKMDPLSRQNYPAVLPQSLSPSFPINTLWSSAGGPLLSCYWLNRKEAKAHQHKWSRLRPLDTVLNIGNKMQ